MRDHAAIVRDYGAQALGRLLSSEGMEVHQSTPQRWADRSSIPGEYWAFLADKGIATLEELAAGAKPRKRSEEPESKAA